jgi:hypothetical protein
MRAVYEYHSKKRAFLVIETTVILIIIGPMMTLTWAERLAGLYSALPSIEQRVSFHVEKRATPRRCMGNHLSKDNGRYIGLVIGEIFGC